MTMATPTPSFSLRPVPAVRGSDVARALSVRFAERGWRCVVQVRPSPAGGEEITVVDQGAVSPDHVAPTFPVDSRPLEEQVDQVLADLDRRGWAGPPSDRAALWCEPA